MCVEDISGRKGRAYQVFSDFIKLLIGHFRKAVDLSVCGVQDKDIQYIMTVPAIWDDSAKLFMRNIATEVRSFIKPKKTTRWLVKYQK